MIVDVDEICWGSELKIDTCRSLTCMQRQSKNIMDEKKNELYPVVERKRKKM